QSANRAYERRGTHAQSAAGSISIAYAHMARNRGDSGAAGRRAGAAVATTLQAASAESGPPSKADHYPGTGANGDGRPHSSRQPKAGHESAQEPDRGNHSAGRNEVHRTGRQQFRDGPQATGPLQ